MDWLTNLGGGDWVGAALAIAGDALWILALTMMFGASRHLWKRTAPGTLIPALVYRGQPLVELPRLPALWAFPVLVFLFSLTLLALARDEELSSDLTWVVFGARATLAPLLALLHLRAMRDAIETLSSRGALKP